MKLIKSPIICFFLIIFFFTVHVSGAEKEMYYRLQTINRALNPEKRIEYMDSLIRICPETEDSLLIEQSQIAFSSKQYSLAIEKIRKFLNKQESGNSQIPINKKCWALYTLARAHFIEGEDAEAIFASWSLLNLDKPDSLLYFDANSITLLNENLPFINGNDSSISAVLKPFIEKENKILSRISDSNLDKGMKIEMDKSLLFTAMSKAIDSENYEDALELGAKILHYSVSDIERMALEGDIAMVYHMLGDYEKAKEYYEKVISEDNFQVNQAKSLGNYMLMLTEIGQSDKAVEIWKEHPDIINYAKKFPVYTYLLKRRSYAEYTLGNVEDAFVYHLLYSAIQDSLNNKNIVNFSHNYINLLNENSRTNEKLKESNRDLKISSGIIFGLGVLCLIAVILILTGLLKRKKYLSSPVSLKDKASFESHETKEGNSSKNKESSAEEENQYILQTLRLASLNESISGISDIISKEEISDKEKISQINSQLKEILSYDNLWEMFQIQFEKIHPTFFSTIKNNYPDVTTGELRMCAYVLLQMSNKEIAAVTRRSIRSVEAMRYRLSKKLNLSGNETLASRLMALARELPAK